MRSEVYFHQDGDAYYVSFEQRVPNWLEEDIERVEAQLGAEYEKRVPDGGRIYVGTIYYHPDQTWNFEKVRPSEIGPAKHPSYEHEFGRF